MWLFSRTKKGPKTPPPGIKNPQPGIKNGTKNPTAGTKNGIKNGTKNPYTPFSGLESRAERYGRRAADVLRQQQFKKGDVRIYPAVVEPRYLALPLVCRNTSKLRTLAKLDRELTHATGAPVMIDELPGLVLVQFSLPQSYHTSYTLAELPGPGAVGLGLRKKPVRFLFEDSAAHAVIAGTTGSGKTTTTTTAIISLAQAHTRDELQFVILDPKRELADDLHNFSYLAWPVIAVTDEEIAQAIDFVADEFNRRRGLPRGDRPALPRLVIVVDEMSLVGDAISDAADVLDNVARYGRALKMNLIIGVQEPHKSESTKRIDGMLLNRFVGLVKSAGDSYLVSGKAGLKAHELTGRGDFIHSHPDFGTLRFQAAMPTAADWQKLPRGGLPSITTPPPRALVQKPPADEPPGNGRPRVKLDPETLAWYYMRAAEQAGWKAARTLATERGDDISITLTVHKIHAPFVRKFRRAAEKWSLEG